MVEHMPGKPKGRVLPAGEGRFGAQAGYVDRGPRVEDKDGGSIHVALHHYPNIDTRYDHPHPNSLLGRAQRAGDTKTLGLIAEGRTEDDR